MLTARPLLPGFINMLAHPEESLIADGRALSDLRQGVTLEVMGEGSMGPLTDRMRGDLARDQTDIKYEVDWTTLGQYLEKLERRGITPNIASFVSAGTIRVNVLGENDVQPDEAQLTRMRELVRQAMEEGALGLTTALIYNPFTYAKTSELVDLASVSARCGGIYIAHIRSEGDRVLEAVRETIQIAQDSKAPAEIYHLKLGGQSNWGKLDQVIREIDTARAAGIRITADMYVYTAGATGLDASMPHWVQEGGLEQWIRRLQDPAVRAKVAEEMRDPAPLWGEPRSEGRSEGYAASRVQESRTETSGRKDARRSRQNARRQSRGGCDATCHGGRLARRCGVLPDVRGQHPPPDRAAVDELWIRRARPGSRGCVSHVK